MIVASHYGTGKHEANISEESIVIALRVRHLHTPSSFVFLRTNFFLDSSGGFVKFSMP